MPPRSNDKYISTVRKTIGRAINQHSLISAGDRVLVALSGGKDSLTMLDALRERLRYIPITYSVFAAHIVVENSPARADIRYITDFCSMRSVPLHIETVTAPSFIDAGKSACFLCSWFRRKALFELAGRLRCNRLALGHHMDDIVETLLMNMTIHGKFSALPLKLPMFNGEFDIIRPLGLCTGRQIERYAHLSGFSVEAFSCPYGERSKREEIRNIIKQMQRLSRHARRNLFQSTRHINTEYLP